MFTGGASSQGGIMSIIGIALKVFPIILLVFNSIAFVFYMCVFFLVLYPCSIVMDYRQSVIAACIITLLLYVKGLYQQIERWLVHNSVSRGLLLIGYLAAGILAGRLLGLAFHDLVSSSTPQAALGNAGLVTRGPIDHFHRIASSCTPQTFELLGAAAVAATNFYQFLKRHHLKLKDCLFSRVLS